MDAPAPITIGHGPSAVRLCVASAEAACHALAAEFSSATAAEPASEQPAAIVTHARFLEFCARQPGGRDAAAAVLAAFEDQYCRPSNAHILRAVDRLALADDDRSSVLRNYYVGRMAVPDESRGRHVALPKALAVFGGAVGDASGAECLELARELAGMYGPLVAEFLAAVSRFACDETQDVYIAHCYAHGLDMGAWITGTGPEPDPDYLNSPPVAMPLLGLVQLLRLVVLSRMAGLAVGQMLVSPQPALHPLAVADCAGLEGVPTPVATVDGVPRAIVEAVLGKYNKFVKDDPEAHVFMAATDTDARFALAGNTRSLVQMVLNVRKRAAAPNEDQSAVPFLSRKPEAKVRFVQVVAPFHSPHMAAVLDRHIAYAAEKRWEFDPAALAAPLLSSRDGSDLRTCATSPAELTRLVLECVYVHAVDWPRALRPGPAATAPACVLSFATGEVLLDATCANIDGHGTAVVCVDLASAAHPSGTRGCVRPLASLFGPASGLHVESWEHKFAPRLVRTGATVHIDTPLHRATGLPPVFVGAVAATSGPALVAAASRAGYLAELDASHTETEDGLVRLIADTVALVQPGHGVALGCNWTVQHEWLVPALRRALLRLRLPVLGLCIGDGVPVACPRLAEALPELHSAGLRYVAVRAGTTQQIRQAVALAQAHPALPVVLQWTGGRNGGRHSLDEFHMPLLQTYGEIRAQPNVVLVAASGMGDAESALPYLTGSWGAMMERAAMPFDGVMLATRVVCAAESAAGAAVKQLIAETPGIDGFDLPSLFADNADGVVSVRDHDGVPVHVVANRAALLCKELGDSIFSQPRDKQPALLRARRPEIAARLAADYMRPWLAVNKDGVPVALEDMTYGELIERLVDLMYVRSERRWAHPTFRNFVGRFGQRAGMRLCGGAREFAAPVPPRHYDPVLDEIDTMRRMFPVIDTQLLAAEDIQFLLNMCRRPGQKAVPFVPVLDEHFADYLLRDSCAQIEDLAAVPGPDPHQRVLIRAGPVAVRHVTAVDEPLAAILDGVYGGLAQALLAEQYGGDADSVPVAAYVGRDPATSGPSSAAATTSADASGISAERTYRLSGDAALLPGGGSEAWAAVLSGGRKCWLHAALTARVIVRGQQHVENFLPRVLRPRAGRTFSVAVDEASSAPTAVTVFSADGAKELELELAADGARLALRIHHTNGHLHRAVCLEFVYSPQTPLAPIHEDVDASSDNIRRFFADIWLLTGDDAPTVERLPGDELAFTARGIPVVSDQVAAFCRSVGIDLAAYPPNSDQATAVPTDYLFVLVLPAIFRTLTEPPVFSSLLHMVQTSLNAEHAPGATPLAVGDTVDVVVRVLEISNGVAGKKVALEAVLHCTSRGDGQDAKLVATLHSEFVFLGAEVGPGEAFRRTTEPSMVATFATPTDVAVLESKEWFRYLADAPARVQPGTRLEFALKSEYRLAASGDGYAAVRTTGAVYRRSIYQRREHIADVDYSEGASIGNPVVAYLQARAEPAQTTQALPDGGYELKPHGLVTVAPASALEYAAASGDHNPHNTNAYVADIAGLPAPLMHGLWSSAATRRLVEKHVAAGDPTRVRRFRARLLGMVFPGDELRTRLFHTAMRNGALVVRGHTSRAETGEVVLECEAEVAQPRTAYVFTGQGSQEPGMLTALCERSPVARQMCDRIDAHVRDRFGFSLLEIVRDNPKECTVHFGGTEGARIRRNYAQFMRHVDAPDGGFKQVPLFDIAPTARCLTFNSPTGLLNSTQFAQPAIMLFDLASVAEMRDRGVYVEDAITAGHSLGEYGAVSSIGFTTPEDIVDVTFIRGATMQATVERDADFNSDFAMVAVNPTRVHRDFGEDGLAHVIDELRERGGGKLLEIVNYNVQQFQYVVAGTRAQLALLGAVLDAIHARQLNVRGAAGKRIAARIMDDLIAGGGCGKAVVRTRATIPIPGIDVPFHSSHLLPGACHFRECIELMVRPTDLDMDVFVGRYIPNLNAVPFDVSPEFMQRVLDQTQSPVVARELARWRPDMARDARLELVRTLTVELLSYQFASPVQWIRTQQRMFQELGVQRVVEIGPGAILTRMAEGTLALLGMEKQVAVLHASRDADEVFFVAPVEAARAERQRAAEAAAVAAAQQQTQQQQTQQQQTQQRLRAASVASSVTAVDQAPASPAPAVAAAARADVPDVALTAVDVICAVIAQKTRRALGDVSAEQSVKELTGGKSTLQNEILGDLLKEFGGGGGQIPDRPDEITLRELAVGLGGFAGTLGKHTSAQVSRLFNTKMPGGFSQSAARSLLAAQFGIARTHQQDAVLLAALTMEPAARLASEADAAQWLTAVAQAYAQAHGFALAAPAAGHSNGSSGAEGTSGTVVVDGAALKQAQAGQRALAARQIEAYARYLGIDLRAGERAHESAQAQLGQRQAQLDALVDELGSEFVNGVRGVFDVRKARVFDSHWNWARTDAYAWVNAVLAAPAAPPAWSPDDERRLQALANRADAQLVALAAGLLGLLEAHPAEGDVSHAAACALARRIHDRCAAAAGCAPVYRELAQPAAPRTAVGTAGKIAYSEEPRPGEPTFAAYVDAVSAQPATPGHSPLVHLRERAPTHEWVYSDELSTAYYAALRELAGGGASFAGCTALVTGCSRGSIAAQVLGCLLAGGARVVATTSSYSRGTLQFYEDLYKLHGARGAELVVVPFNQGSVSDIRALVAYIYGAQGRGLGWSLDYVLPFAAISEFGCDVSRLGSRSELAARIMLTNVMRLLGEIRSTKTALGQGTRQTMAVLPLSPNHGVFGNDGLYGESKAALETAFNRWASEGWGAHMSVAGAVIGWTRGTGLMSANNTIAAAIEAHGARTFSTAEMAFNLMGLLHPDIAARAQDGPLWADLNGGLQRITRVNDAVSGARAALHAESGRRSAAVLGYGTDFGETHGPEMAQMHQDYVLRPLFNHAPRFARAPAYEQLAHLRHLEGMVNLDQVVVVTGYGEVGPYGNAETRWEMEAYGEFSLEGCVELAWIMGLIRHVDGPAAGADAHKRQRYAGWVDAASGEPVADHEIKARYEARILEHTGIRMLEPALLDGQDPAVVPIMRELQLEHDMEPFEASADEASVFKLRSGDCVDVWPNPDGASWSVRFLRGAVLMVPKALRFDRLVGAQLPTGWDPARYGIPADVIEQVDPVTCYALVATAEALVRSGITDPYELYRYFHVAEVGTSLGSGAGGATSIRDLYCKRLTDKHVQSDILQETFANTTAAWINMLLLSSAGAIKPPTGGCGTSVLSVDIAADTIRAGKARVMVAGAFEGFVEQGSYEFAQMGATSNAVAELAAGRTPREMSRPSTSTRTGFVEAQGAGVVVLMSASAALEFGAPVYAVLGYSGTATDKQGQSLPAPGMGVLTSARHAPAPAPSRALDMGYRRRQIARALRDAEAWAADERALADAELPDPAERARELALIAAKLADRRGEALNTWGHDFWRSLPDVSPLRGSLAVWGLTADDIGLASFHGTATVANDWNEATVLNEQLRHIGRSPGLPVPAVCQKWLTGHPKGPAAAWMVNGAIQSMRTGLVPGNRNADNIDSALRHEFIVYPSRSIQTRAVKAALLKSFGFGQVGAEILLVHPDYLLATLGRAQLDEYAAKLAQRETAAYRYWQDTFVGSRPFVQVKAAPPYTPDQEKRVLLDPRARAQYDPQSSEYRF